MSANKASLSILLMMPGLITLAQDFSVKSPDNNIAVNISNAEKLHYSVTFKSQNIINRSPMGFEFKDEEPMTGNFLVIDQKNKMSMRHGSLL